MKNIKIGDLIIFKYKDGIRCHFDNKIGIVISKKRYSSIFESIEDMCFIFTENRVVPEYQKYLKCIY